MIDKSLLKFDQKYVNEQLIQVAPHFFLGVACWYSQAM